ncbi:MAG TPA: efflux RND transporter periplasmic adaptor subunit [Novosphingobium sp.]|nr:efflux RND transporter periplasmic adaptor subunit [Novosphingobium sp.]
MNYDAKIDPADEQVSEPGYNPLDDSDEADRLSNRRMWIFGAIAIVLLVGLWIVNHFNKAEPLGQSAESQAPAVTVFTPGRAAIAGKIEANGTLAARREMPVGVAGEGGQIARVLVEPGDWVRAGQVLAVIDRSVQTQQQASQAAQIEVAAADARLAQANLDRALKLVDRGFISKADVDRLRATRDAAAARVRVARAQLGETRALTNRLDVVAPAAGLVLERKVEPGQVVSAGTGVLFRLARGGEMELLARLSEDDLAKVSAGVAAMVVPVGSGKRFSGQVWQVSPVIDPQNRQGSVRIALAYAPELRPGGFASTEILSGSVVAPLLPESAVLADNQGSYVYIVDKDNKVVRRKVKTGILTAKGIAVTEGLAGNERIVLRAGAFLSSGETVRPKLTKLS